MEQDNWDKRIQEIQQKKEVTPSLDTRNKLASLLANDAKRAKKNQKIWWSAAAIALLFLVGSVSIWRFHTVAELPVEVVGVSQQDSVKPVIIAPKVAKLPLVSVSESKKDVAQTSTVEKNRVKNNSVEFTKEYVNLPKQVAVEMNTLATEVVVVDVTRADVVVDTVFIEQKDTKEYVSAADLLAWANGEKPEDSLFQFVEDDKMYVASDSLLRASQKEIFEEKNGDIFQRLGRKLKKLKSTVAQRNYK